MNKWKITIYSYIAVLTVSCGNQNSGIDSVTYSEYQIKGDEITNQAQATLLSNVGKAIQTGGTEYAVEFCNLKASSIVDSLNTINNCTITRISEKYRNPDNTPKSDAEKEIILLMTKENIQDTLIRSENLLTYFKPIRIGLPACLKCHGNPDSDIDFATLLKIKGLYPNDLATDYQLNDFRGMWKVEFTLSKL